MGCAPPFRFYCSMNGKRLGKLRKRPALVKAEARATEVVVSLGRVPNRCRHAMSSRERNVDVRRVGYESDGGDQTKVELREE